MAAKKYLLIPLASILALTGCAGTYPTPAIAAKPETVPCQTATARLDTNFPSGNVASCKATGPNEFTLTIDPEDAPPINCSAWYAFRLTPREHSKTQKITIKLDYEFCGHRYWPKSSVDGLSWDYLPRKKVTITEKDGVPQARLTVRLRDIPKIISAQEIIVPATYRAWLDNLAASPSAEQWMLGQSAEGRDIPAITIKQAGSNPKNQIVLIGRQHPPEITGALALFQYVETLNADTELARKYRARFSTIVVPMLNPDGVVRGHWRHNSGGTDLNRDWGPFAQPETRLMDSLLEKIAADPEQQLAFFADFHSTQNDIFYTITDAYPTTPRLLIKNWLERLQERMPKYRVNRSTNEDLTQGNSKNYVYRAYGVPTVTYEMGDETDRKHISKIAREAATAMMETLLASEIG